MTKFDLLLACILFLSSEEFLLDFAPRDSGSYWDMKSGQINVKILFVVVSSLHSKRSVYLNKTHLAMQEMDAILLIKYTDHILNYLFSNLQKIIH